MNKRDDFLNATNVEILWDVIAEQNMFQNRRAFERCIVDFYEREKHTQTDLVMLNKGFITSIISKPLVEPPQKIPITFEELQTEKLSQFELKLTEKEDDFKQYMARPMPHQIPNFRDKMDEPLTEIELIMKRTIAERNYDVAKIANANANVNTHAVKNALQPQETSIKKEKLSPLFFSSLHKSPDSIFLPNPAPTPEMPEMPEIKYIKIDKSSFKESPVPISLDLPLHQPEPQPEPEPEQKKHISWNDEIQKDYFYNSDGISFKMLDVPTPPPMPNRVEQMKKIHDETLEVFRKKNTDYGDSFATYGIIGILIRIEDKMRRAISISKNGVNLVKDEGIRDTLLDLHNYAAMGLMLLDEKNG